MSNGGYQKGKRVKGLEELSDWRFRGGRVGRIRRIRRQGADSDEEVEESLEHVDNVTEVVVLDELVVGSTAGQEKDDHLVYESVSK